MAAVDRLDFSVANIEREEDHGKPRRPAPLHHLSLVPRLIERMGLLLGGGPCLLSVALDVRAGQQRLIGIHGRHRAARGQSADAARFSGIGVRCKDGALANVVDPLGLSSGLNQAHATLHNLPPFPRGQVENRNALRRAVDQLPAIGGVAVLVEVEARAAGFAGEAQDAVAGSGIDPGYGRFGSGRLRIQQGKPCHEP